MQEGRVTEREVIRGAAAAGHMLLHYFVRGFK